MCGFSGIINSSRSKDQVLEQLSQSIQNIAHRGPDALGTFSKDQIHFAHARLAVLDLDERSNQPFLTSDKSAVLLFNGEIYNFRALREELLALGSEFRTEGDTEVLAEGLKHFGKDFLPKLQGCYAIAYYHISNKKLLLARDPLGIKPLWYAENTDGATFFSSELKGLLPFLDQTPIPSSPGTHEFLRFSYNSENAFINNTYSLPPGGLLEHVNGKCKVEQHFDLSSSFTPSLGSQKTSIDQLEEALFKAVEKRMIADVQLGSFLSGGLDSALIASIAKQIDPKLKTYTLGFEGASFFDESAAANHSAQVIGSEHQTFIISKEELEESALNFGATLGMPFGDSSALLVALLSKKVKQEVSVILSGDGADELFAGYEKHRGHLMALNPGFLLKSAASFSSLFPVGDRNTQGSNALRKAQKFQRILGMNKEERYQELRSFAKEEDIRTWTQTNFSPSFHSLDSKEELQEVLYNDQRHVLCGDMLSKVDLMSMHFGLEVRVPFLDLEVVKIANGLPSEMKFGRKQGKQILRDLAKRHLPQEILSRPKRGFELPLDQLLEGVLQEKITACASPDFCQAMQLNSEAIEASIQAYRSGDKGLNSALWNLHVLRNWWSEQVGL